MTVVIGLLLTFGAVTAVATHVGCGDTIVQDTTLDSDLLDCPRDGIVIGADRVTLDLGGHVIDGDATGACCDAGVANGRAFVSSGFDDVVVQDGFIRDYTRGVELSDANRNLMRRLDVSRSEVGIFVSGGGTNRIQGNAVRQTGDGVFLASANNRVVHNAISGVGDGVKVDGAFGNEIAWNTLLGNFRGVFLVDTGATGNHVHENIAVANTQGIALVETISELVDRNIVYGNGVGIRLAGFGPNAIERNLVSGNQGDGILIESEHEGHDNLVARNFSTRNGDDGIDVDEPATTVARNRSASNGDLGIEAAAGTTDGGKNRAFGNGNPLECLNVVCK